MVFFYVFNSVVHPFYYCILILVILLNFLHCVKCFLKFVIEKSCALRPSSAQCGTDSSSYVSSSDAFEQFELVTFAALKNMHQMSPSNSPLSSVLSCLFKEVFHILGPVVIIVFAGV